MRRERNLDRSVPAPKGRLGPLRGDNRISRLERWTAGGILFGVLVLRILYAAHYRIDSDEPQHLHVVWGWTHGMIPYRDFFDNHSPLFQLLCSPVFASLGERGDIIIPMRLLMILPFAFSLWAIGRIGTRMANARTGLWAAVFAAVCPSFFFVSTEFRPDDLWACLWFLFLLTAIGAETKRVRGFLAGLILGLAFCVSMKTTLMLIAVLLATTFVEVLEWRRRRSVAPGASRRIAKRPVKRAGLWETGALGLAGMLICPALVLLFFQSRGALPDLYYCVIEHNIPPVAPGLGSRAEGLLKWFGILFFPLAIAAVFYGKTRRRRDRWAWWLLLVTLFYTVTLKTLWPIVTDEDFLPSDPLFMAFLALALFRVDWKAWTPRPLLVLQRIAPFLPATVALPGILLILNFASPLANKTRDKISMVSTVLRLTGRDDYVLDSKGETIYRRRPIYFVMEGLTGMRMKAGLINENMIERLIETETPVATVRRMPSKVAWFIRQNYLPISFRLSVLGKILAADKGTFNFDIAVPGSYTLLAESGQFEGLLNGQRFTAPSYLSPGHYVMERTAGSGRCALFWARAAEEGFGPFNPPPPDQWTRQD